MTFVRREENIKKEFAAHHTKQSKLLEVLKDTNAMPFSRAGDPPQKKFDYPVGKRPSKAITERLRQSEAILDLFWDAIDKFVINKMGSLKGTHLGALLI